LFINDFKHYIVKGRDVSTGTIGTTAVAPKFSYNLTHFQPEKGPQGEEAVLPTISDVAPKFSSLLHPWEAWEKTWNCRWKLKYISHRFFFPRGYYPFTTLFPQTWTFSIKKVTTIKINLSILSVVLSSHYNHYRNSWGQPAWFNQNNTLRSH
jgi:hypothetical protein